MSTNRTTPADHSTRVNSSQDDTDAIFASLENESEADNAYREQRIEQLNAEFASIKPTASLSSAATLDQSNTYPTLATDQSVLDFTTQSHRCVVHFAHPEFTRCAVMDEHLRRLAMQHYEVRFAKVDARDTPFIVKKLGIRVLPCVIGFRGGVSVERIVGFEGLGAGGKDGTDQFSSVILEKRLLWKGVLTKDRLVSRGNNDRASDDESEVESNSEDDSRGKRWIRNGNARSNVDKEKNDDDDDDWD